ncbi:MAG: glycosyltransferase, partial [Nitrososphaeria archaeon]|nr:glycosyltransferase [Nitrososphaeria archaeon]
MDPKISVLIPVYRESDLLPSLLRGLLNDPYDPKEIIVIIDEPTEKSLDMREELGGDVRFVLNGKRKGKANVLNEAVNESCGDILLFLDADVTLPDPCRLLEVVFEEAKNADLIEIKKTVIRDSILARAVTYDYVGFNSTNWIFSRTLGRCLGFNGAAFAIRREAFEGLGGFRRVISEDLDMGIRSFIGDLEFRYVSRIQVYNKAP